jgi:two-component system LytT family response regulator
MKAIIIDDQSHNRDSLATMLQSQCPEVTVLDKADSVISGVASIRKHNPDLIFLDIEMDDGTGFDLLSFFPQSRFHVIFITAHDKYAIEAFKVNAIDYLLKPLNFVALIKAVEKVKAMQESAVKIEELLARLTVAEKRQVRQDNVVEKSLSIPTTTGYKLLNISDIIRLESDGRYTIIVLNDKNRVISARSLGEIETKLPEPDFFRSHRSHIVHLKYIDSFNRLTEDIEMSNGDKVPLAKRNRSAFLEMYKKRGG